MFAKSFFTTIVENTVPVYTDIFSVLRKNTTVNKRVFIHIHALVGFQRNFPREMYACAEIIGNLFGIFASNGFVVENIQ